jgi:hypothetical protein
MPEMVIGKIDQQLQQQVELQEANRPQEQQGGKLLQGVALGS